MISGTALINPVVNLIVSGLVFWILWWLVDYVAPPEPFRKIANVLLAIAAALVVISVLLGIVGHPLIRF